MNCRIILNKTVIFYPQKFINLFKDANHIANQPGGYTDLAPLMGDTFDLDTHTG